ncbi:MAG: phosphoglucosamine mutase [Planctomycetota bacterium]
MADAPLILGVSGLRGIVGESLTPEVAVRYAGAFASWMWDNLGINERPVVFVGRDGRRGGEGLSSLVSGALLSAGCDVVDLGVAMTPTVGAAMRAYGGADGGVIITASHNPAEWNGLKLLVPDARIPESEVRAMSEDQIERFQNGIVGPAAPSKALADALIDRFQSGAVAWRKNPDAGTIESDEQASMEHARTVVDHTPGADVFTPLPAAYRAVIDSVNCSGAVGAADLVNLLGSKSIQLHGDGSGIFPHTPEPTAENLSGEGGLCDAVPGLKADVGFAQDPDADRLAIVDERGRYIGEEYTLVLCAQALLRDRGADEPTAHLVANLSTSRMIDDVAAKHGAVVHRTAVGEANVVERMKALKAEGHEVVLGGEGNGGVIWPEVVYVRDSLGSMALVLSLMARTGKTVSELVAEVDALAAGGAGYAIVKRKVEIASKADAEPAVQAVARAYASERVDRQDGVRVDFDSGAKTGNWAGSWVHVRASNTEPIMRVIVEAPTAEAAGALADEVGRVIAAG